MLRSDAKIVGVWFPLIRVVPTNSGRVSAEDSTADGKPAGRFRGPTKPKMGDGGCDRATDATGTELARVGEVTVEVTDVVTGGVADVSAEVVETASAVAADETGNGGSG